MFLRRRKRPELTIEERRLLGLLLDGDTAFLAALRRQVDHPDFHLYVEHNDEGDVFRLTFVTDGRFTPALQATSETVVELDDLEVRVHDIDQWLAVTGVVHEGILGIVKLRADRRVRWPRDLRIIEWRYRGGGRTLAHWDLDVPEPASKDDAPQWLRPFLDAPGVTSTTGGAAREDVEGLPKRLAEFLRWSDGATLFGAEVLGTTGLYEVEHKGRRLLVFSPAESGSFSALDLDVGNASDPPVVFVDIEKREVLRIAPSFRAWVQYLSEEASGLE